MRDLRIFFPDWNLKIYLPGSEIDNLYTYLLSRNYNVIIDSINPEVVFYDLPNSPELFSKIMEYKNCIKIFCTNEPNPYHPNDIDVYKPATTWIGGLRQYECIKNADYILTSYKIDSPKNYYVPTFLFWLYHHIFISKLTSLSFFTEQKKITKDKIKDRKFSIYLHNNNEPKRRRQIYEKLNNYKHIDTKSEVQHLISQYLSLDKINLIKNYKFTFAMQNHSTVELMEGQKYYPGFICEKIIDSYFANTIPIYYGNDKITEYFNEKSFINWHSFDSDESFINKIIELDNNDDLYLEYLNQPTFLNLDVLRLNELSDFLKKIIG